MYSHLNEHLAKQQCPKDLIEIIACIATGGKDIAWRLGKGALAGVTGAAQTDNVQGERQQQLDIISNDILKAVLLQSSAVFGIASEEEEQPIDGHEAGSYVVAFDPLDGSSNIDVNISVGTIFSILPAQSSVASSLLQSGRSQVASGYVLYGASTLLVLSVGRGTHLYLLDRSLNEFVLIQASMNIVKDTKEFAINMSNQRFWRPEIQNYIGACLLGETGVLKKRYNMRWVASMVADVHRIFMRGGIFMYPWDNREPDKAGKLRLIYEANPMSFLVEQAGGKAMARDIAILDVQPTHIHQRVPVVLGSAYEVDRYLSFLEPPPSA